MLPGNVRVSEESSSAEPPARPHSLPVHCIRYPSVQRPGRLESRTPPAELGGTIGERPVAVDGSSRMIPMTTASVAEVLRHHGHRTAAFGKWHTTPATEITALCFNDRWPTS